MVTLAQILASPTVPARACGGGGGRGGGGTRERDRRRHRPSAPKINDNAVTGDGPGADTNSILVSAVRFLKDGYELRPSEVGAGAPVQGRSRI